MAYWNDRLKEQKQNWDEAGQLPDGNYQVMVNGVSIIEKFEKLKLKWETVLIDEAKAGRKHTFFTPLEGAAIGLSKHALKTCGLNCDIDEIEDRLIECVGQELEISLKSKILDSGNKVQNTSVVKNLKEVEIEVEGEKKQTEDDIPWN